MGQLAGRSSRSTHDFEFALLLSTLQIVNNPVEIVVKSACVCCTRAAHLFDDWIAHHVIPPKAPPGYRVPEARNQARV